jgi:Flp pilus assembly pilin Flp
MPVGNSESGSASVEHAALVLLAALVACVVVAVVAIGPERRDGALAAAVAFKQRCAVRYPDPCWQDPLTEAYGRSLAGVVRALAPPPESRIGPDGSAVVGVDYRRCRQVSCAVAASQRLTTANRRTTAFTSIHDHRRTDGSVAIEYWVYRPTIGWELITREASEADVAALAGTPLPDSADPALVPLETLLGRDDARFRPGEEPPWRGQVESGWGR